MTIVLIKGNNLLSMDSDGYSDPYVKFRLVFIFFFCAILIRNASRRRSNFTKLERGSFRETFLSNFGNKRDTNYRSPIKRVDRKKSDKYIVLAPYHYEKKKK